MTKERSWIYLQQEREPGGGRKGLLSLLLHFIKEGEPPHLLRTKR